MIMKRILAIVLAAVLLLTLADVAWRYIGEKERTNITVSATLRQTRDGYTYEPQALPAETGQMANGRYDEFRRVSFKDGILYTGFEHGPITIQGIIPAENIRQVWADAPEDADWPFSISFYNQSTGRVFHIYLAILYDTETGLASADLYIFQKGYARPITSHWEGELYELVNIAPENMDI